MFYTGQPTITRMSHGLDEQSTFQLNITEAAQAMRWWKPSKLICIMFCFVCVFLSCVIMICKIQQSFKARVYYKVYKFFSFVPSKLFIHTSIQDVWINNDVRNIYTYYIFPRFWINQITNTNNVMVLFILRVGFNVKKKFQGTDIYKVCVHVRYLFPIVSKSFIAVERILTELIKLYVVHFNCHRIVKARLLPLKAPLMQLKDL